MILKIPERIKYSREKNKLTQSELAKKMFVTRSSVNAWEMGISIPTTEKIAELSNVLNVSTDFILGIDDGETICLDGLSDDEKSIIYALVKQFKKSIK